MPAFLDPPVSSVGHISALGGPGPGRQSPAPVSLHPESKDSSGLSHRSQGNGPPGAVQVAWTVPPVPGRRQAAGTHQPGAGLGRGPSLGACVSFLLSWQQIGTTSWIEPHSAFSGRPEGQMLRPGCQQGSFFWRLPLGVCFLPFSSFKGPPAVLASRPSSPLTSGLHSRTPQEPQALPRSLSTPL